MRLDDVLNGFLSTTQDAVAVSYCAAGDDSGSLSYVNDGFSNLFGYETTEVLGRGISMLHRPADWQNYLKSINSNLNRTSSKCQAESMCLRSDGSTFWASISLFFCPFDEMGGRYGVTTIRDITNLRQREDDAKRALQERDQILQEKDATNAKLLEVQSRLMSAMDAHKDPVVIFDRDMFLVTSNTAYRASMSNNPDQIKPRMHVTEILNKAIESGSIDFSGDDRSAFIQKLVEKAYKGNGAEDFELVQGQYLRFLRSTAENGDSVSLCLDITELVRQRRKAEAAQERLITAMDSYPDPFCIYDKDGILVTCNSAYASNMANDPTQIRAGISFRDAILIAIEDGIIPEPPEGREEYCDRTMHEARALVVEDMELAGDIHQRLLRNISENGDFFVIRVDITEIVRQRRKLEENARQMARISSEFSFKALHDDLTGLGNRRFLREGFEKLGERRRQKGGELAALHLDLDRFKQINDTIGHAAGDHVLVDVASRIRASARPDDLVARIGGDEFIILIWEKQPSGRPMQLACQLVEDMSKPTTFEGRTCRFGASVGIAHTPLVDVGDLLTFSDIALYKAKRAGRNQVAIFDTGDVVEMRNLKETSDDILRGLEQSEFVPHYQPQIDAKTDAIVGVEVLARWHHPEKGVLSPDYFLSISNEMNVVSDLDHMIFEKAMDECKSVFSGSDTLPSLSFNVSAKRVSEGAFDEIERLLRDYPGEIAFELLETIFLEEEGGAFLSQLDRLRKLGVLLEVDDFGSGHASVVALQRIAPQRLKIDQRLVLPVTEGEHAIRLVKSIIDIGNALNIGVVAEGVETKEHACILSDLGAERLQGFYFARPMPIGGLRDFVESCNRKEPPWKTQ